MKSLHCNLYWRPKIMLWSSTRNKFATIICTQKKVTCLNARQRNRAEKERDNKWYLLGGFWLMPGRQSVRASGQGGSVIALSLQWGSCSHSHWVVTKLNHIWKHTLEKSHTNTVEKSHANATSNRPGWNRHCSVSPVSELLSFSLGGH